MGVPPGKNIGIDDLARTLDILGIVAGGWVGNFKRNRSRVEICSA
jgi:hypothetical protein